MNNKGYMSFEDFQKESFKNNPELEKAYHELDQKYEIISNFIKLRNELNLTQKDIESITGVKQESLSRFESGNLKNVSLGYLSKLIKPLGYKINLSFEKV